MDKSNSWSAKIILKNSKVGLIVSGSFLLLKLIAIGIKMKKEEQALNCNKKAIMIEKTIY